MLKFFEWQFNSQLAIHRFCHKKKKVMRKCCKFGGAVTLLFIFLQLNIKCIIFEMLMNLSILFFLLSLCGVYLFANGVLTSLRKFLSYGIVASCFLYFFFYGILHTMVSKIYSVQDKYITSTTAVIITFVSFFIEWLFISYIVNNKIATLTNAIFSAIIGVTLKIIDVSFALIPPNYSYGEFTNIAELEQYGYTSMQSLKSSLVLALTPLFITNVIATLLCAVKGYWIHKYNNDNDITMELIEKIGK